MFCLLLVKHKHRQKGKHWLLLMFGWCIGASLYGIYEKVMWGSLLHLSLNQGVLGLKTLKTPVLVCFDGLLGWLIRYFCMVSRAVAQSHSLKSVRLVYINCCTATICTYLMVLRKSYFEFNSKNTIGRRTKAIYHSMKCAAASFAMCVHRSC